MVAPMNHLLRPVQITPEAHLIQSYYQMPGAPTGVQVNTMVLAGREPVVFDTGVEADRFAWLNAVTTVVEPEDVRWIVLTHDDHDHVGNLVAAMGMFPNATVVASWWLIERLGGSIEVDPTRLRWVGSGETLDVGDRVLAFERPPLYDSPSTRAVLDTRTGLYWGGDLGAAPGAEPYVFASEAPAEETAMGVVTAGRWISPWVELVDDRAYQAQVTKLERMGISTWASTHAPVYDGPQVAWVLDLLRQVPHAPEVPQPGQADLDAMLSAALEAA